jgi:hypothetical protein
LESNRSAGKALPVLREPSTPSEPRECPFDNPSFGDDDKPFRLIRVLDDLDAQLRQHFPHASLELRFLIATIGIELEKKGKGLKKMSP